MLKPFKLDSKVVIATHHKAGSIYSYRVFGQISREFGWTFRHMQKRIQPEVWDVAYHMDATSRRLREVLRSQCKLLHFVRHPKALIVSGVRYHMDAEEAWLDQPRTSFEGRSYRQVLRGLETMEERIRFEMRNKGRATIRDMLELESANLDAPKMTVKLEDVSHDSSERTYTAILRFLGFEGEALDRALAICVRNALWSMGSLPSHARGGVDEDWKDLFTPELNVEFEALFGNAEEVLGYRRPPFPTACRHRASAEHMEGNPATVWFRIPKCAGTSIEQTLDDAGLLARRGLSAGKVLMVPKGNWAQLRGGGLDRWGGAWKFAVVRNPWDRFISGWKYVARERTIRDLLRHLPPPSDFHRWHHVTRLQSDFLLDEMGRLMPDYLVRFECLEEDLNRMFDRIGLPRLSLRHEKRGQRRSDYRSYYDEETRDLVGRIFRKDVELLGYQF